VSKITFEELKKEHKQRFIELEEGSCRNPIPPDSISYFDTLNDIASLTYDINEAHFPSKLAAYSKALKNIDPHEGFLVYMFILAGLEGTEVSETIEDARKQTVDYLHLLEEQADVFIRSMNAIQAALKYTIENNLVPPETTLASIVKSKIAKNIDRPLSHGNKRF